MVISPYAKQNFVYDVDRPELGPEGHRGQLAARVPAGAVLRRAGRLARRIAITRATGVTGLSHAITLR
jgi:hypothetical protein